jgi:hypothetical protein
LLFANHYLKFKWGSTLEEKNPIGGSSGSSSSVLREEERKKEIRKTM